MKRLLVILPFFVFQLNAAAQTDSIKSNLIFESDFRFRIEQDWHTKKSDGSFQNDRTRLRYRFRIGAVHKDKWYEIGFRLRTGNPLKQQDPQLTLGGNLREFGPLPIGFEKAYFKAHLKSIQFWAGKNNFPFEKNNELFWSDNVFPEGLFLSKSFKIKSAPLDSMALKAGHFIISTAGQLLGNDCYFQGYQAYFNFFNNRLELFPSLYLFRHVPNIPDGNETFEINYSILHTGLILNPLKTNLLKAEFDYYYNFDQKKTNDSIPANLKNQNSGIIIGLKYGNLKQKGTWMIKTSYALMQKYAAVDFLAQNDWARWDYTLFGSPDGRLTNFNGIEVVIAYKLSQKISLKAKYYLVEQLVPINTSKETSNRVRLDLDIKF